MQKVAGQVVDAIVESHGSLYGFRTYTPEIRTWFDQHTDAPRMGSTYFVEPRYAGEIAIALGHDGFTVI